MKITHVEALPVGRSLFVVVDTDEGLSGVGETGLRGQAVEGAVRDLAPLLIGEDANRIEHLWQVMFRGRFFPGNKVYSSAIAGIDIALWDIQAKARGVPVYQLLGGLVRDRAAFYSGIGADNLDEVGFAQRAIEAVGRGWKFLRWSPGYHSQENLIEPRESLRHCLKQLEAVRTAVGDDIEICIDLHTRMDAVDSIWFCREAERFHPYFIEDPIRSEGIQALRQVRQKTSVPLAMGEHYAHKWEFREMIEEDLIDYARVDVCIAGGITEARKIIGWCETHYIRTALHNPLGPASTLACLHLDLAASNFGVQEIYFGNLEGIEGIVQADIRVEDGYFLPPQGPGLGIEINREAARRWRDEHPVSPRRLPLHRRDGAFTNW